MGFIWIPQRRNVSNVKKIVFPVLILTLAYYVLTHLTSLLWEVHVFPNAKNTTIVQQQIAILHAPNVMEIYKLNAHLA